MHPERRCQNQINLLRPSTTMVDTKAMPWTGQVLTLEGRIWTRYYADTIETKLPHVYRILTGDNAGLIYSSVVTPSGVTTDSQPFREHKSSVEDLQWSPTERSVFASCSADQTVKIWDTRNKRRAAVSVHASTSDVNVITWNKKASYLLASGHDDGTFSVWDLRQFKGWVVLESDNVAYTQIKLTEKSKRCTHTGSEIQVAQCTSYFDRVASHRGISARSLGCRWPADFVGSFCGTWCWRRRTPHKQRCRGTAAIAVCPSGAKRDQRTTLA